MLPKKQLVWYAGELGVAANLRRPVTWSAAELNWLAANASTVKPAPCGLLTREKPEKVLIPGLPTVWSVSTTNPYCEVRGRAGQRARRLVKTRSDARLMKTFGQVMATPVPNAG